jgi:hypothetical protein
METSRGLMSKSKHAVPERDYLTDADLTPAEGLKALESLPTRLIEHPLPAGWEGIPSDTDLEILYDGVWRVVDNTTLIDKITTAPCSHKSQKQWLKYWTNKVKKSYGVRIQALRSGKLAFSIVTELSDG